jgi:hypothetical protein
MKIKPYDPTPCGAYGPDIRVSPSFKRAACCNRITGHDGDHCERNDTFHVMARWSKARSDTDGRRRRV